jgi:hypothetical protein
MKPNDLFLMQPKSFWANVRSVSQTHGYTEHKTKLVKTPTLTEIQTALTKLDLNSTHLVNPDGSPTVVGSTLVAYFNYRAKVLNEVVEPLLMDAAEAKALFLKLYKKLSPKCPIPMNKQKGVMAVQSFMTGIINMIVEANAQGLPCDYNPMALTTVTLNGAPLRTLARRVDGAFTSSVNPVAIWEIKEYYFTTTFGSRVADGVYESLLDGMELEELRDQEGIDIKHYLFLDSHYTWWECGRSYLCRVIDMLHMGYVDEVMFGKEVVSKLPAVVAEWVKEEKRRQGLNKRVVSKN